MELKKIIYYLKKYKIYIVSVLCTIILITLILRYIFTKEGFSNYQKLIETTEHTENEYIWSNKLFNYINNTNAYKTVIFVNPKNVNYYIGSLVTTDETNYSNLKSLNIINTDLYQPEKNLQRILTIDDNNITYNNDNMLSYLQIENTYDYYNTLKTMLNEYNNVISNYYINISKTIFENISVFTYKNIPTKIHKNKEMQYKFNFDLDNDEFSVLINNIDDINALSIPFGSNIEITYLNQNTNTENKYTFSLPIENLYKNSEDGKLLKNFNELDINTIFGNEGYNVNLNNPFGIYSSFYKINNEISYMGDNNELARIFHYHNQLIDDNNDFFKELYESLDRVNPNQNKMPVIIYIIDNKKYIANHIADINFINKNNNKLYNNYNKKFNIKRKVYIWESCIGADYIYDNLYTSNEPRFLGGPNRCYRAIKDKDLPNKKYLVTTIGYTTKSENGITINSEKNAKLRKKNKPQIRADCCAYGLTGIDLVFTKYLKNLNPGQEISVIEYYKEREWNIKLTEEQKQIKNDKTNFDMIIEYHAKDNYNIIYSDNGIFDTTNGYIKITKVDNSYVQLPEGSSNSVSQPERKNEFIYPLQKLIMKNIEDITDLEKRNLLSCFWHDNEYIVENKIIYRFDNETIKDKKINGLDLSMVSDNVKLIHDRHYAFKDNHKYSSYLKIKFKNSSDAKEYVSAVLNNLDKKIRSNKFRNMGFSVINKFYNLFYNKNIYFNINNKKNNIESNLNDSQDVDKLKTNIKSHLEKKQINIHSTLNNLITNLYDEDLNFDKDNDQLNKLLYVNLVLRMPYKKYINNNNSFELSDSLKIDLQTGNVNNNILKSIKISMPSNENNPVFMKLNDNINRINTKINNIISEIDNINQFNTKVIAYNSEENKLNFKHFPLQIHRYTTNDPNYICLGDIVSRNGPLPAELDKYICIPKNCTEEVRDWLPTDKIFEYSNNSDINFSVYKNPFTNTFKVALNNSLPSGKVVKVVACVNESPVILEFKNTKECIKETRKLYDNTIGLESLDNTSKLMNEQNETLRTIILDRDNKIKELQQLIKTVENEDIKASIIESSRNRAILQEYIDKQLINIDKLIKNLFSLISIKINKVDLISLLQYNNISIEDIENIIQYLEDINSKNDNIANQIDSVNNIQINNDNNIELNGLNNPPDSVVTQPEELKQFIYRIENGETQKYVLRSLVESSCGCYFTDEELLR